MSEFVQDDITYEFRKIFKTFNREYFNSELSEPMLELSDSSGGSIDYSTAVIGSSVHSVVYRVPKSALCSDIYEFAFTIICLMIDQYDYTLPKEKKLSSNRCWYHNKKYADFGKSIGLGAERLPGSNYGWRLVKTRSFMRACDSYHFVKRWNGVYEAVDGRRNIQNESSSTRKYICPKCGMSVRATRFVNIVCGDCMVQMRTDYKKG